MFLKIFSSLNDSVVLWLIYAQAQRAGELAALLWALLTQQLPAHALLAGWVCACWSGQGGSQLDV